MSGWPIHCNQCGARFSTVERHRRFCSAACARLFKRAADRAAGATGFAPTQAAILSALRGRPGEWVSRADLLSVIYGNDDEASRRAFNLALHRLRYAWASDGLVIACRQRRPRLDVDGDTFYRLERDVADVVGVTS